MAEGGPAAAVNGLTVGTPDLDPVFFGMWTPSTEALPPNSQVSTRARVKSTCVMGIGSRTSTTRYKLCDMDSEKTFTSHGLSRSRGEPIGLPPPP